MINFRIVALDPGGTTGWAAFSACLAVERRVCRYEEETWSCGQLGPGEHHDQLNSLLGTLQVATTIVVCEAFTKHHDLNAVELASVEYIGVTKRFCQERKIVPKFQTSTQGKITDKSFVRKANLEALSLWSPGMKHAMDATGHLLYCMLYDKVVTQAKRNELFRKGWK